MITLSIVVTLRQVLLTIPPVNNLSQLILITELTHLPNHLFSMLYRTQVIDTVSTQHPVPMTQVTRHSLVVSVRCIRMVA